jgi:hypothetical protein
MARVFGSMHIVVPGLVRRNVGCREFSHSRLLENRFGPSPVVMNSTVPVFMSQAEDVRDMGTMGLVGLLKTGAISQHLPLSRLEEPLCSYTVTQAQQHTNTSLVFAFILVPTGPDSCHPSCSRQLCLLPLPSYSPRPWSNYKRCLMLLPSLRYLQ